MILKQYFFLLCLISSFVPVCLSQQSFNAKVVGVVDGDTITVLTKDQRQLMLRLAGIDAPEKEQEFGINARKFLSDLVLNQTVTVSNYKKDCLETFTASISFKNKDLSSMVIESGNAWADSSCQTNEKLAQEEANAKEKKIGLWQNPTPLHPLEFRKRNQPLERPTTVKQERLIFTGLGPAPKMPENANKGLYIGMTLNEFIKICGEPPEGKTNAYSSSSYQSASIRMPDTKENKDKGCHGSFSFERTSSDPVFKLRSVSQDL